MATSGIDLRPEVEPGFARRMGGFIWLGLRLPLLALLIIVEPIARFVLTALALLGVLVSLVFEFSGAAPRFPFWLIFGMSLGCGALVIVLNAVTRRLAR